MAATWIGVWTWIWPTKHCGMGQKVACWFQRCKNSTGFVDMNMDRSALGEKPCFKMLGLTFSSKLDWGCYIISIAKTASKKIGALICSMKFLSPEVALYLYKSTICPCMKLLLSHLSWCPPLDLLKTSYKNGYAGLLVLHLLLLLNPWLIIEMWPA